MLSCEAVLPLARDLAHRRAHIPDDVDDLIQTAMFWYHRATQRPIGKKHVSNPWALARTILDGAMRYYYNPGRKGNHGKWNKYWMLVYGVSLSETPEDTSTGPVRTPAALTTGLDGRLADLGTQADLLELNDYFRALERRCGVIARVVAQHLVSPTGPVAARAVERARAAGPQSNRKALVTPQDIRTALGLPWSRWNREMTAIRTFTREWLAQESA